MPLRGHHRTGRSLSVSICRACPIRHSLSEFSGFHQLDLQRRLSLQRHMPAHSKAAQVAMSRDHGDRIAQILRSIRGQAWIWLTRTGSQCNCTSQTRTLWILKLTRTRCLKIPLTFTPQPCHPHHLELCQILATIAAKAYKVRS